MTEIIKFSKQERHFTVELTQDTYTRFIEMVYADGITPSEVLESFINDLVCGTYTRGSDERMYAQQYYDRCMFRDYSATPLSFCRFILREYGCIDVIQDSIEYKQTAEKDLEYYKQNPNDPDGTEDFLQELRETIQNADYEIEELYQEYKNHVGTDAEPKDKALQGVSAFLDMMKGEQ